MSFLLIPVATTRDVLLSDGLLFATGIIWGTETTARGQAYRTQDIYIGTNVEGVYLAAYPYTDAEYPKVRYRTVICSYKPLTCYITPLSFNDVSTFSSSNVPYFGEINTINLANNVFVYQSLEELKVDFTRLYGYYPITYRLTNCTAPDAPSEASVGSTVIVPFAFPDGYGIVNNENVYVTNNGVIVPSTYSDGVLTFEMPNPD